MKRFKNIILVAILAALSLMLCAFSVENIYQALKEEVAKQLALNLNREVSIGSVKGILAYQVELYDIKIAKDKKLSSGTVAQIDKAVISYNPLKFLINRADIIPAISKIDIYGLKASVIREPNGEINVAKLLPQEESSEPQALLPFYAHISVKSGEITFIDYAGYGGKPLAAPFKTDIQNIAAELNFQVKGRLFLGASGRAKTGDTVADCSIKGGVNLYNAKYEFETSARNLDLKKWGWYVLPIDNFRLNDGTANLDLTITTPIKGQDTPVAMHGTATFKNSSAYLFDYYFKNINGRIDLTHDSVAFNNLNLTYQQVPALISGKIYNFADLKLDLNIASQKDFNLSKLPPSLEFMSKLNLSGPGSFAINIKEKAVNPKVAGYLQSQNGRFYGQPFSGKLLITYQDQAFNFNVSALNIYGGTITGPVSYSFLSNGARIKGLLDFKKIDIARLSNNAPGITGTANGKLILSGSPAHLNGELIADLVNAETFGQPVESLYANFAVTEEGVALKNIDLSSEKASFFAKGSISKNMYFDLATKCSGLKLKGEGLLGKMEAEVENFNGQIAWQLNSAFLQNPIKNLNASGTILLKNCILGDQIIETVGGGLVLNEGIIKVENLIATSGKTVVHADGEIGNIDSSLVIKTKNAHLSDLKILNILLPEEHQNPTGLANLNIIISGALPPHLKLDSLAPLLDLNYEIYGNLIDAQIDQTNIYMLNYSLAWKNKYLQYLKGGIKTKKSAFEISYGDYEQLELRSSGKIDLEEFELLLSPWGRFEGLIDYSIQAQGEFKNPHMQARFNAKDFRYNSINFDHIQGAFIWKDFTLKAANPAVFNINDDRYTLSGKVDFKKDQKGFILPDNTNVKIAIDNVDLSAITIITHKILDEINRILQLAAPVPQGDVTIAIESPDFPNPYNFNGQEQINFYAINNQGQVINCFLQAFDKIAIKKPTAEIKEEVPFAKDLAGNTKGTISIEGPINKLKIQTNNLEVESGRLFEFDFDKIKLEATYYDKEILLDRCSINKSGGDVSLIGKVNLNTSDLNLKVSGKDFPADSLRLIFPGDKKFEGKINVDASIFGTVHTPEATIKASSKNLVAEGIHFEKVALNLAMTTKAIIIDKVELKSKGKTSYVSGIFPASSKGAVNLSASIEGNSIGIINLLTQEIIWKEGEAYGELKITGQRNALNVNGNLNIDQAKVYVSALKSTLKDVGAGFKIKDSVGTLDNLSATWKGARTQDKTNTLKISGLINVKTLLSDPPSVSVDLKLEDTDITVDLPDIISGDVSLKDVRIAGPFYLTQQLVFKKGPKLSGKVTTTNCSLFMPKGEKKEKKIIYLDYDLILNLDKGTYAIGGDITSLDFAPIINLEVLGENLIIKGNSRQPSLFGELNFRRGTIAIFDREFSLLAPSAQARYYSINREMIHDNVATFKGGTGKEALIPDLDVTGKIIVDNYIQDADGKQTKEKITVLAHITGMPYVTDEQRGIKIVFDSFKEEAGLTNIQKANFTQDEIKVLLLPDFLKGALGLSETGAEGDSSGIVVDYLASRAQTYLSRTVGRQLEQQLGLDSLTLEYNFGRELRRNIAGTSPTDEEETLWGVGMAKGFFDKFYIEARYSEAVETQTDIKKQYFNYELSYKLSDIWSIAYYEEPSSFDELLSGNYKLTLQAGLKF
ncbi:MAG: translocation/assembly module TamB domain-containing protein [Candidatus Margulisbacteria bacterium]|nr:translocation/assembly module TamB domain-containing protein [Candidatus Margulisiibacteriota bacterium]MBU1021764.1 translocation/assembly module TamB domain-containing protein [Candidatus Margulisiibacteriota bacterium]MBU1729510.1 translocation/assembly module TamB domain-containing protein [Candidatus Margulisiibacteriota bacterium]MBU1955389.1 translocation/assembly module TamB domain-containing protein [Candidatus Margulisiibacteriota bacterium]